MDGERELALRLANEFEMRVGYAPPEQVADRARVYLDFLAGTRDAIINDAARKVAEAFRSSEA